MARTIIDLPEPLMRDVDELCRLVGMSRAEAVRRALKDYLRRQDQGVTDAFGLWRQPPRAAGNGAPVVLPAATPERR